MHSRIPAYLVLVAVIGMSAISFFWDAPVHFFESLIGENIIFGALVFVAIMFVATVIAPITTLPLVPLIAPVLGPFTTGTLSIIGWGLGAIVAFLIARHAGRPLLGKFISLSEIDKYESYIPKETRFFLIVMLRMMVPVDILSYALGLFSRVSLTQYTFATFIGITWFAYAFAYLGSAALKKDVQLFGIVGTLSIIILGLSAYYVVQQVRKEK